MEAESASHARRAALTLWALVAVVAAGFVVSFALPQPQQRKYPQRLPVRFWHMWTAEWKTVVDEIVDEFNRSQDVYEVIALSVPPADGQRKFVLAVAGGDPPDVMAQWDPVIPNWADSGLLQPLDELLPPEQWEELRRSMYPVARKIGTYKGRFYGVTIGLNIWACYYRLDHLEAEGLRPEDFPKTLEELCVWGQRLNRFDERGNLTRLGFLPEWYAMIAPLFGDGFYDWHSGKLLIDTPDNLRALEFLTEQRRKLGYDNVVRFRAGLTTGFAGGWPFISGAYSITVDGQWRVEQLRKYAPELRYGTAPLPPPAGGRKHAGWSNGNFMVIPRGARQRAGAWEFIKFWSGIENPQRAASLYIKGGWLPLRPEIAAAPAYRQYIQRNPQFQTFLDVLPSENIHPTPPVPYQVVLWDNINRADDLAMRGLKTPAEALRWLREQIEQEQARRREFGYAD